MLLPLRLATAAAFLLVPSLCAAQATPIDGQRDGVAESSDNRVDLDNIKAAATAIKEEQYAIGEGLVARYPHDFDAHRVMGFVHSSHGNQDQMRQCWLKCRELNPKRADIHDQLGRHAMQIEDFAGAIEHFQTALELDPKLAGVHERMGSAYTSLGRIPEAKSEFEEAIAEQPNNTSALYQLAEVLFQTNDLEGAKSRYEAALAMNPDFAKAHYGLIKTCARLGLPNEAQQHAESFQRLEQAAEATDLALRREYDDLRRMRQKLATTCVDAGRVCANQKNLTDAIRLWRRAVAVDESNIAARQNLAGYYLQNKQDSQALEQIQWLVKLLPNRLEYHRQAGFLNAKLGNLVAAENAFRRMIRQAPKSAEGYRALAKLYLNTKRQRKLAEQLAERAVELEPSGDSYFVLGWARAANGKRSEARQALEQALKSDPENRTYKQLYDAITQQPKQAP